MQRILVVDDEKNIRTQLAGLLTDEGFTVEVAGSAADGRAHFEKNGADLVLLDVWMPGGDGLTLLSDLRASGADVQVIVMSGQASIETAVKATKLGAWDYLEKPLAPERLLLTLRNALENKKLRRQNREFSDRDRREQHLIGSGAAMQHLDMEIARAAASEARVLIGGENGTGKELVARALHQQSRRAEGPFIKVNCAAIPKDLIESELFGHEKGAFTGADRRKIGRIEAARGGTLLLDEVGDMALEAQAKLLRVLEENELERVGGTQPIAVDARVISATNKDLSRAIADGLFREDLFYRLNVIPIAVPALRERLEDVPELVDHFHQRLCEESGRALPEFTESARAALQRWSWPGNVRELRNVVERLAIMIDGDAIDEEDVARVLQQARADGFGADEESGGEPMPHGLPLRDLLELTERQAIEQALAAAHGTVSEAARTLGIDRANLHRKMRRLGISKDE